jgi:hypothetical protein
VKRTAKAGRDHILSRCSCGENCDEKPCQFLALSRNHRRALIHSRAVPSISCANYRLVRTSWTMLRRRKWLSTGESNHTVKCQEVSADNTTFIIVGSREMEEFRWWRRTCGSSGLSCAQFPSFHVKNMTNHDPSKQVAAACINQVRC